MPSVSTQIVVDYRRTKETPLGAYAYRAVLNRYLKAVRTARLRTVGQRREGDEEVVDQRREIGKTNVAIGINITLVGT